MVVYSTSNSSNGVNATLNWSEPVDEDFQYFSLYRDNELLLNTTEHLYEDSDIVNPYAEITYSITATDIHENESVPLVSSVSFVVTQAVSVDTFKVNMFSLNIQPTDMSLTSLISDNISLMVDDNGNYFYPSYNVDQIGDVNMGEGYQIIISGEIPENMEVTGIPIYSEASIILNANKQNMIPYLPQSDSMAISEVFASYNDNILLVKDDDGKFYVPADNIDDIVTMYPGEGYYVYLRGENDLEFSYPINGLSRTEFSDILETERIARTPVHYKIKDTGISHPIIITDISGVVEIGDELSAYANNELVGAQK